MNGALPMVGIPVGSSLKRQAAVVSSDKLQAGSYKLQDSFTLVKFQATSFRGLDQDEAILRMFHMERNLVWGQTYFVTLTHLKF